MNIEEIIQPGEIVLYNSKSKITNQKIYRIIFLVLAIVDAISFYFIFTMDELENSRRLIMLSAVFLLFVYFLCGFIVNMYRATNNTAEYWITNVRVIALQRNKNVIINELTNLAAINVLKFKKNIGTILLIFDMDESFIDNVLSSVSNRKDKNKIIRLNSIEDPMKAVRIIKNVNDEVHIMNDNLKWEEEDEEDAK